MPAYSALLCVAAALAAGVAGQDCELDLQLQTAPNKEPLLLEESETRDKRPSPHLIYPKVKAIDDKNHYDGVLPVRDGDKLLVACLGRGNYVYNSKQPTDYLHCSNGKLTIRGKLANNRTLSCTKSFAESTAVKTKETCGDKDQGTKFELGFQLNDDSENALITLVDVCHNIHRMETYYSHHEVYGASLRGAVHNKKRKPFDPTKQLRLFAGLNVDRAYSKNGQNESINAILGGENSYVTQNVFLARGHLAPDADFIYNTGQQLTYYFINVAPQWQTFNAGNWLGIENAVRALATELDSTLEVYTGTYGILKLKNAQGEEKEIYLNPAETSPRGDGESHLPVPEYYWKLVKHNTECTVAVGINNVFLKEEPTDFICTPRDVAGWPVKKELSKGYMYYCDYESFKKTVQYAPEVECTALLSFPSQ